MAWRCLALAWPNEESKRAMHNNGASTIQRMFEPNFGGFADGAATRFSAAKPYPIQAAANDSTFDLRLLRSETFVVVQASMNDPATV